MSEIKKITKPQYKPGEKPDTVGDIKPEDDGKDPRPAARVPKAPKAPKAPRPAATKKTSEPKKPTANKIIGEMILSQKSSIDEIVAAVKKAGLETECPTTTKCRCVLFNLGKAGHKGLKLFNREGTKLVEFTRTKKEKKPTKKTAAPEK
jgi:hypothetical protein